MLLVCAFEVPAWRGEVTVANQERGGHVRRATFLPYAQVNERLIGGSAAPMRDWFAAPGETPRTYWFDERNMPGPRTMDLVLDPGSGAATKRLG